MRAIGLSIVGFGIVMGVGTVARCEPFDEKDLAPAFTLSKTCANVCSNDSINMVRLTLPQDKVGFLITTNDQGFCGSGGCSSIVVVVSGNKFVTVKEGLGITKTQAVLLASREGAPDATDSLECSKQADAQGLHRSERLAFLSRCKGTESVAAPPVASPTGGSKAIYKPAAVPAQESQKQIDDDNRVNGAYYARLRAFCKEELAQAKVTGAEEELRYQQCYKRKRAEAAPDRPKTVIGGAAPAPNGNQPSFNCATVKTASARLICSDAELSKADAQVGAQFQSRRDKTLTVMDRNEFIKQQLVWIKERNQKCGLANKATAPLEELAPAKPCMLAAYKERSADFGFGVAVAVPNSQKMFQPSFNCALANQRNPAIRLTCSDEDVANADVALDQALMLNVKGKDASEQKRIYDEQQAWRLSRNSRCALGDDKADAPLESLLSAKPCVLDAAKTRIAALSSSGR